MLLLVQRVAQQMTSTVGGWVTGPRAGLTLLEGLGSAAG